MASWLVESAGRLRVWVARGTAAPRGAKHLADLTGGIGKGHPHP